VVEANGYLSEYADGMQGICSSDFPRFGRYHWEVVDFQRWRLQQDAPDEGDFFSGRVYVIDLDVLVSVARQVNAYVRGQKVWGTKGVAVAQMRSLARSIYSGHPTTDTVAIVRPHREEYLLPILAFCESQEYVDCLRKQNPKLNLNSGYMVKVPFDLSHWQAVAAQKFPHGLPKPYSSDPKQWIFHGHPAHSKSPLQVAVARLVGFQWPSELGLGLELSDQARLLLDKSGNLQANLEEDGIICIPSIRGKQPAAERLHNLLAAAYGDAWSADKLARLLSDVGHAGKTLESWLRDKFFEQHCKEFNDRPFVWHIWDGLRDGFGALVNYRRLDAKALEALIYIYLADWITRQKRELEHGLDGAEERLVAAENLKRKLELIAEGERPYDIFVRWKRIEEQPVRWNPDVNDGIRVNIRPFMTIPDVGTKGAGVLRDKPNITWGKDRGKDGEWSSWFAVFKGERINDHHLSLSEKLAARRQQR
jgi:hypothetical protein